MSLWDTFTPRRPMNSNTSQTFSRRLLGFGRCIGRLTCLAFPTRATLPTVEVCDARHVLLRLTTGRSHVSKILKAPKIACATTPAHRPSGAACAHAPAFVNPAGLAATDSMPQHIHTGLFQINTSPRKYFLEPPHEWTPQANGEVNAEQKSLRDTGATFGHDAFLSQTTLFPTRANKSRTRLQQDLGRPMCGPPVPRHMQWLRMKVRMLPAMMEHTSADPSLV